MTSQFWDDLANWLRDPEFRAAYAAETLRLVRHLAESEKRNGGLLDPQAVLDLLDKPRSPRCTCPDPEIASRSGHVSQCGGPR